MVSSMKNRIPILKEQFEKFGLEQIMKSNEDISLENFDKMNLIHNKLTKYPEFSTLPFGEFYGLNLILFFYHSIFSNLFKDISLDSFNDIAEIASQNLGKKEYDNFQKLIVEKYEESINIPDYKSIIIWLCNQNPALKKFKIFFDDKSLINESIYYEYIEIAKKYFEKTPTLVNNFGLFELLLLPSQKFPNSIFEQLNYIRSNFDLLPEKMLTFFLQGIDLLQEENTFRGGGPGPTEIYQFEDYPEYEKFTEDKDWMSHLVLIAKSTFVWLSQLSRKYGRKIHRLDEIPEQELIDLSQKGFNGLWLIGIWNRSQASGKFKNLKGNPDALASAYSLKNYSVSDKLGGDLAMSQLQKTAWKYGIRIGCDMVPNHMGIDSDWIVEHPDWFLQTDQPPFAAYSFNSQNLSERPEIEVFMEDHYYDETDAAIVFKMIDRRDGKVRFIYHGNDGTSIPWNDTAQLNYSLPEVREAIIQEIITIAKTFPVIRFDAAMVLAKKHIQRLWFPEAGSGGAIPSRSRFSLSKKEFNFLFPNEFWREVVDRVAIEAPDTLLLAEAFWMMEGYFVRTLGMHRVYNSAFMNMLKNEENDKYQESDEETAIDQFGTNDKYFGVCTLMVTMPGLPMFAHGQIEGFTEKYGMEYSRPKRWEKINEKLLARHQKEIFPLLKKRYLFSDVENFVFYNFWQSQEQINKNVFAYSNKYLQEKCLIIFHNSYANISGFIHNAKKNVMIEDNHLWKDTSFAKEWNLSNDPNHFAIFTDTISGLIYLRNSQKLHKHGLSMHLRAYEYVVLGDVYEVNDVDGNYKEIYEALKGRGTKDLSKSLKKIQYKQFLDIIRQILSPVMLKQLVFTWQHTPIKLQTPILAELESRMSSQISTLCEFLKTDFKKNYSKTISESIVSLIKNKKFVLSKEDATAIIIAEILFPLEDVFLTTDKENWYQELLIKETIIDLFTDFEINASIISENIGILIKLLPIFKQTTIPSFGWITKLLENISVKKFLGIHKFDNSEWFNKEAFEEFLRLLELLIELKSSDLTNIHQWNNFIVILKDSQINSQYKIENLLAYFKGVTSWVD